MKLKELLKGSDAVGWKFLYDGTVDDSTDASKRIKITKAAKEFLMRSELQGDDWKFIGEGCNNWAVGNEHYVLKLEEAKSGFQFKFNHHNHDGFDVPEELAAKVITHGNFNGVYYHLCERLSTEMEPNQEDIISFLFKARDAGYVYWDGLPSNFGYDADDNLKVIDHEHFSKIENSGYNKDEDRANISAERLAEIEKKRKGYFADSIKFVLDLDESDLKPIKSWPFIFSDEKNTYVILAKELQPTGIDTAQKRMLTSLKTIGIEEDKMEIMEDPPLFRIPQTKIQFKDSGKLEMVSLASHLRKVLKAEVRETTNPTNSFLEH